MSQHPGILNSSDVASKRESPISLHYKLFAGTHVPDSVGTSGQGASTSSSKEDILAELKDTCRALDETIKVCIEKKIRLESLIKALTEEGVDVGDAEEEMDEEDDADDADEDSDGSADI